MKFLLELAICLFVLWRYEEIWDTFWNALSTIWRYVTTIRVRNRSVVRKG